MVRADGLPIYELKNLRVRVRPEVEKEDSPVSVPPPVPLLRAWIRSSVESKRRTAARPCLEVGRLVVAHRAVDVGQAVAHGRHDDAVAQLERSDVTGRKQMFE